MWLQQKTNALAGNQPIGVYLPFKYAKIVRRDTSNEDNLFVKISGATCPNQGPYDYTTCSRRSRPGLVQEDKRMAFVYTHGLFIT
jgi:hypothetical protein